MKTQKDLQPSAPVIGRYADALLDRQFRRIFGTEQNKRLTLLLLRTLIPERNIHSIQFVAQEHVNPYDAGKDIRVDVECLDDEGVRFVVEMQLARQEAFYNRAVLNTSFALLQQAKRGSVDFDFPPVYFIGIMDFSLHPESDEVLWRFDLRERREGKQVIDCVHLVFLELPNCVNALTEKATELDKLCYTLHNMHKMEQAPEKFDTELITLLLKSSETTTFTPQERAKYLHDMTTKRDIENYISYARKEGLAAGVQKGREEGLADGIEKGLAAGIEKGTLQANMEAARKMKELGADMDFICQVTGLTPEQVAAL